MLRTVILAACFCALALDASASTFRKGIPGYQPLSERLENQDKRQQERDQGQHPCDEDHQEKIAHFDDVRCGMIFPSVD